MIDPERMPRHVAIVMDGNRRWARAHYLPKLEGHRRGVRAVRATVEASLDLKIPTLTLYTFSSENWKRPRDEVSSLMDLLSYHLRKEVTELHEQGVRFRALGRIHELSPTIQESVREMEEITRHNTRLNFNIALNYGGRQELVDVIHQLAREVAAGTISPERIDEAAISDRLTTAGQPDPDLLIRTGGDQRLSNFLLWQMAYTELVFLPIFWPDFTKEHLEQALVDFARRERRFGAAT